METQVKSKESMAHPKFQGCISVDVPGDVFYIECILSGQKLPPRCAEYDHVEKSVDNQGITRILCPEGCVKTAEDVHRKCGIYY